MKLLAAIMGTAASLVFVSCTHVPVGDPAEIERINAITRTPARTETETPAQRARRELREKAFGEKIGLLSVQDAYDPPRLIRHVAAYSPPGIGPGTVEVAVIIDTSGRVTDARIISATHPALEVPALIAVKQWRFTPGRKDGQLIGMSFIFPVAFRLK